MTYSFKMSRNHYFTNDKIDTLLIILFLSLVVSKYNVFLLIVKIVTMPMHFSNSKPTFRCLLRGLRAEEIEATLGYGSRFQF